jgi:hypothetical protein
MKIDEEELQNVPLLACVKKKSKHSFKKIAIVLKVISIALIILAILYFGAIVLCSFLVSVCNGIYSAIIQVPIWILVPVVIVAIIISGVITHSVLWCLWQRPSDDEWKRAQNSSFLTVIALIVTMETLLLALAGVFTIQIILVAIGCFGFVFSIVCICGWNHNPYSFCVAYWMYRKRIKDTTYETPVIINNP